MAIIGTLKFTDNQGKVTKTLTACDIKAGVFNSFLDIAERADGMDSADLSQTRDLILEMKTLISKIFGVPIEAIDDNCSIDEIMRSFQGISEKMGEMFTKNSQRVGLQ